MCVSFNYYSDDILYVNMNNNEIFSALNQQIMKT